MSSNSAEADFSEEVFGEGERVEGVAAPVEKADRIETLDFIRGLAVMGILAANIISFGQIPSAYMFPDAFAVPVGDPGGWMWIAQFVLIDGKMRFLFNILFGAGIYLFMERAWARGSSRWLQAWRLTILMVFGLIHFFFIWMGDILFYYGLFGLAALLCMNWKPKTQLVMGFLGYLCGAILFGISLTFPYLIADTSVGDSPQFADARSEMTTDMDYQMANEQIIAEYKVSGDYAGYVSHRLATETTDPLVNALFFTFETLPLMLIGMALYRLGFFSGGVERSKLVLWGWITFVAGGFMHLGLALFVKAGGFTMYGTLAAFMGWSVMPRLFMGLGLAALLVAYSPGWTGWFAERVKAAGRAAFTNYLGTSIVMLFIMHGWALGFFGELNRPELYILTAAMWVLMLAWSKPWLERFRYGPLEWLWRCLTYRKLFPLKR